MSVVHSSHSMLKVLEVVGNILTVCLLLEPYI